MNTRMETIEKHYSRRNALTRLAQLGGVGALSGTWPALAWAEDKKAPSQESEPASRKVVSTARLTPEVRGAIKRGLEFLAKPEWQDKDGSWKGQYSVAFTSVSLMAFMLEGHVPGRGRYGAKLEAAIDYLVGSGRSQGGLMCKKFSHAMYEHGLGVLALSEAWGQSQNPRIRRALMKGVDVILRAQNKQGSWGYTPDAPRGDMSQVAMQMVALASAKEAGIVVPQKTIDRAIKYIFSVHNPKDGGFGYMGVGSNFGMTAAALTALMLHGVRRHPAIGPGLAYLKKDPFRFKPDGRYPFYVHYYSMQAMYQAGEAHFQDWYPQVSSMFLGVQQRSGSWNAAQSAGAVFATSMAILILGVPYRFLPIYQR